MYRNEDEDDGVYILIPRKELINRTRKYHERAGTFNFLFSKVASNQRAIGNIFLRLLHDYGRDTITESALKKVREDEKQAAKEIQRKA